MTNKLQINIGEILKQKTKKQIPKFFVRLLEKLIHQEEINTFLDEHGGEEGIAFTDSLLQELNITSEWLNPEQLPQDGRKIFVCNHPLGAIDGITLCNMLAKEYGAVRFLVNDILYHLQPLRPLFLPVNSYGRQSKEQVSLINETLDSDVPIGSFPAGYCSRHIEGKVQDKAWKKSFIKLAIEHQRDIVPLHFVGQNSKHFYFIDRLRKFLGIKFDLSTTLLPDEMFRAKGKHFQVIVGETIPWQSLKENPKNYNEIAQDIRAISYQLKQKYKE